MKSALVLREREGDALGSELHLDEIVLVARTAFQSVLVGRSAAYGRVLVLDGSTQSCESDEGAYHSALAQPALLTRAHPRRVLIAGGGEGATAREVLRHDCVERVDMVDIDGELVALCKQHLEPWHRGAFDDPRLRLHARDIRAFVEGAQPAQYDALVHDLGDPTVDGPARRGFTREFFALAKRALVPGGVVALQAGNFDHGTARAYRPLLATLSQVFRHVVPYRRYVDSWGCQWGFILASDDALPVEPPHLAARLDAIGPHDDYDADTHRALFALTRRERALLAGDAAPYVD